MGKSSKSVLSLYKLIVLALICILGFSVRLFSVIRYESVIHEFDPYFNYRSTIYLLKKGIYSFLNWFDERSWYPLGRPTGTTLYPGLMLTAGTIYKVLHFLHFTVDIRNICVLVAPLFSGFTALATYFMTCEIWDDKAGLFSAILIAIVPGYMSRSVAGSFDNEAISIFTMILTLWLWLRALRRGTIKDALICSFGYLYMVAAWGGYVFLINLIPFHAVALLIFGKYSKRLYVVYSTFYIIGTLFSFNIPFVGINPINSMEHMAALGTFILFQIIQAVLYFRSKVGPEVFNKMVRWLAISLGILLCLGCFGLVLAKKVSPLTGRFYTLFDPTYAIRHIPIIASVSEHQPSTWVSYIGDLHILMPMSLVGIFFCIKRNSESTIFALCYVLPLLYFLGVMVRIMLMITPIACVLAAIGFSVIISRIFQYSFINGRYFIFQRIFGLFFLGIIVLLLGTFVYHANYMAAQAYSSPSIVLSTSSGLIIDDFRESYRWLGFNTDPDAKIMSWWDYGYQLAHMSNRTTIVDNNTWNTTHIAQVGRAFGSTEDEAYKIVLGLDVDYVLVLFGGQIGYSGDDINKFIWMLRIAGLDERKYFSQGQYRVGDHASPTMKNCLMYKLCYYKFDESYTYGGRGIDVTRREAFTSPITLKYFEEAYTSKNWLVRIYKFPLISLISFRVMKPNNRLWEEN